MEDSNKNIAISFLKLASNGEIQDAFSKYVSPGFMHHNPFYQGSAESLETGMKENALLNPDKVFEIKRVIAEDDFVVTYSHVQQKPADLGAAVVHIFRFQNGKIVELWDLGQPVPAESPNQFGMF